MREDFWRFAGVLLFSLLLGYLLNEVAIFLVLGLLVYILWSYRLLRDVLHWLQKRNDSISPEHPGIIDNICREIDFLKSQHKKRAKKLTGYLKRFQDATSALPDAVVVLDDAGAIEWANDKAGEYLGVRWPQDNHQRIFNLIRNPELNSFMHSEETHSGSWLHMESPVTSGQILEVRKVPYGEDQKLLVARDITSIFRNNQMRKDFIANASHELRTPLTVISGYLEGLDEDDSGLPQTVQAQIRQMHKQADRMQRLIEDLLKLSALETTPENLNSEPVPVPEMLASIYQEAEGLSGNKGHIFYLETDPALWLKGNQRELYSAFSNLVFNAIQYTPARGVIRLRWFADDSGPHFSVSDNGVGIAPEHIHRITERFYRVDKARSRDQGGTGLGLAIVKHVIGRHKGRLHIESTVGKGSLFRCDFPPEVSINRSPHTRIVNQK